LPEDLTDDVTSAVFIIKPSAERVECLDWHPTVASLLAIAVGPAVQLLDITKSASIYGKKADKKILKMNSLSGISIYYTVDICFFKDWLLNVGT
jgi:hypothetical protein